MGIKGRETCTISFNLRMTPREYRVLMHHAALTSASASSILRRLVREQVLPQYLDIFGQSADYQIELPMER